MVSSTLTTRSVHAVQDLVMRSKMTKSLPTPTSTFSRLMQSQTQRILPKPRSESKRTNSSSLTNTKNVESKEETTVQSQHQKHALQLLWRTSVTTSCSLMTTQTGDADAVPAQTMDHLT